MAGEIERNEWQTYLDDFSKRNVGRRARVEVISISVGAQDAAEMLPFAGVTFDAKGTVGPSIEIMLGGTSAADAGHLTHAVNHVRRVAVKSNDAGQDDALEIEGEDGAKTLLIFEKVG